MPWTSSKAYRNQSILNFAFAFDTKIKTMGVYILLLAKYLTQIKIWRNAKVHFESGLWLLLFFLLFYLLPCLFLNFLIATAFMCNETAFPESWFVYLLNFVYLERFVAIGEKSNLWEWTLEMISVIWSFSLSRHLCGHFKTKVYFKGPF